MRDTVRRMIRIGAVVVLATTAGTLLAGPAGARATSPDAQIRAAHFSPTTPGVDVYLGRFSGNTPPSKLWLSKVRYGTVSGYQPLTPGVYTVAMRPAGASASSPPVLSWTLHAKPDAAYTVAGVGAGNAVRGVVVKDDLSAPPTGKGRVRVIQAASRAPVVSVSASGGHVITRDARFATVTGYATLPAGSWTVQARDTTEPAEAARGPVTVRAGAVTSILLLDAKTSGITLRTVLDSASSGVRPADAVPAGAGGTATDIVDTGSSSRVAIVAGLLLALSAGTLAVWTRGHRSRGSQSRHRAVAPRG